MFDPRIYRAALLPAVAAFVVLMFSFEPIPNPLPAPVSTPTFDGAEAARTARSIVELAPDRQPGSTGDGAVADLVRERFAAIEGGEVAVQSFDSSFDGDDVTLRNVILTLPGSSERTILVLAHRDSAEGPGAATSAAATATLLGLADDLGRSRRSKTIIFASTDGGSDGAEGARKLIEDLPDADLDRRGDRDLPTGRPRSRGSIRDRLGHRSRERLGPAHADGSRRSPPPPFGQRDPDPGPWVGLSRLAFPIGIGEQAAIRRDGTEAIAISAHGERQIPASEDEADTVSSETLGAAGSTLIDLIVTLDEGPQPDPGPNGYIRIGDNLVPGLDALAARDHAADRPAADRRRHLAARAPQRLADAGGRSSGRPSAPCCRSPRCCSRTCSGSSA